MRIESLLVAGVGLLLTPHLVEAWEYRCRFVERVGTLDIPLADNTIDASSGQPRRIRIQFGVFDDDLGAAPVGGFVGWNVGSIVVSGASGNSDERRTPGRLTPFFTQGHGNGEPFQDPFDMIDSIDALMGPQAPLWLCNADGTPGPLPAPRTWGLNTYASVYEITIDPRPGASSYTITYAGNLIAAVEWRIVGQPIPPDCGDPGDPNDDVPGQVAYAPFPTPPSSFECTLGVLIPAPPTLIIAGGACLCALPRRRPRG